MFGGKREDLKKRSAVFWVNKFNKKTPVLLLHGSADWRVAFDSPRYIERCCAKNTHRLVLLEGADHGLEFRALRFDMMRKWFDRFVEREVAQS